MPDSDTFQTAPAPASPAPAAAPVSAPDVDFPVPLARFLPTLRKTHDEVWTRVLTNGHAKEKRTMKDWSALLDSYKGS